MQTAANATPRAASRSSNGCYQFQLGFQHQHHLHLHGLCHHKHRKKKNVDITRTSLLSQVTTQLQLLLLLVVAIHSFVIIQANAATISVVMNANIAMDAGMITPSTTLHMTYYGEATSSQWLSSISNDCDTTDTASLTITNVTWYTTDASCGFTSYPLSNSNSNSDSSEASITWNMIMSNSNDVAMKCVTSGVKQFYVTRTASLTSSTCTPSTVELQHVQWLNVLPSSGCYQWYVDSVASPLISSNTTSSSFSSLNISNNTTWTIRIWAYDPFHAHIDEMNGNATLPSLTSAQLSEELSSLGEVPTLTLYSTLSDANFDSSSSLLTLSLVYDAGNYVWQASFTLNDSIITSSNGNIYATVDGRGIMIIDCMVSPLLTLLPSSRQLSSVDTESLRSSTYIGGVANVTAPLVYDIQRLPKASSSLIIKSDACSVRFVKQFLLSSLHIDVMYHALIVARMTMIGISNSSVPTR
jgi:hypothetical protein